MVPSLPERFLGFGGAQGEVPPVQDSAPAQGNESVNVIHTLSQLNGSCPRPRGASSALHLGLCRWSPQAVASQSLDWTVQSGWTGW